MEAGQAPGEGEQLHFVEREFDVGEELVLFKANVVVERASKLGDSFLARRPRFEGGGCW